MSVPVHLVKVLDALGLNPALPADMVRRLLKGGRGMGRVAQRPDLTADMITEILDDDRPDLVHMLALNRRLPNEFRERLVRHPDNSVRFALVIGGEGAPPELFEPLIDDPDRFVRELLTETDRLTAAQRGRLAADPDPEVRATLARWWPDGPIEVRRALLTDPDAKVRAAACSTYYARGPHPVPPADLIPALLADPATRTGVLRHVDLDHETAARLVEDPDHTVRQELAKHPQLPTELRDVLAGDPDNRVRVGVFARPDTPEALRAAIYAQLRSGPDPVMTMFARDVEKAVREKAIADHWANLELATLRLDWVKADPLPHVDSPYPCFRAAAAANRELPPDVVARLLDDPDSRVRTTMARHAPDLVDAVTMERIDREFAPVGKTRWRPADLFDFSPETLRRFATDPDGWMRQLAPRDPDLPAELAAQLAKDPSDQVRLAVAGHANLPASALVTLLADEAEWVARAAAGSPVLPVEEMDRLLALADL